MVIVAITGTPGTGKDTVSKQVAKMLGWKLVDLNRLAKDGGLIKGFDKKRSCEIVDISGLRKEVKKIKKDVIIQSHYSHELNPDLVIVLRTNPNILRKRLEKRGWPKEKVEENIEAEIMEICKDEVLQKTNKVFEVDTNKPDSEKSAETAVNIIYREVADLKKDLKIPNSLIELFKKPYGKLFKSTEDFLKSNIKKSNGGLLITVGDFISYSMVENGVDPDIIVFDNKVRRLPFKRKINFRAKIYKVINRPGITGRNLWKTIRKAFAQPERIKISVIGEEDLALLPSVIMAPLGSVILYGQPNMVFNGKEIEGGLVAIKATAEKKKEAWNLFKKMLVLNRVNV